ncbi:MAG: hypothetical protein U9N13_01545 [Euryarchaeota archaeon]|nr:hypothetical protein [Euryarchaeota archaeon]
MLTSVLSTTTTTTTTVSAGAISMMSSIGLPEYGVLAVIALILLLSAKEILSASRHWNTQVNLSLNMAIFPLLTAFVAIVIFKVAEII